MSFFWKNRIWWIHLAGWCKLTCSACPDPRRHGGRRTAASVAARMIPTLPAMCAKEKAQGHDQRMYDQTKCASKMSEGLARRDK
jgi:hypothetical protein